MTLTLNGKPFKVQKMNISARAQNYLDTLRADEILTTQELSDKLGITTGSLKNEFSGRPQFAKYKHLIPHLGTRRLVWGNPKAIQELRKQLNEA